MARRAKFGIAVRAMPNIGGTLISLAREMQARQDSNIIDAWRNGGEYQGKKVTDQMVLDYWEDREKGLDPKDPAYDTVRDNILQLRYGIEQSKMDLLHVQGKISDTEFAQFYLKWSKKVPKQSEFWRSLQKDAAQLMAQAKERARLDAEKAKTDRFNAFVSKRNDDIGLGNAVTDAINALSQETGLSITDNGDRLLELLTEDYKAHPDKYAALADAIKAGDGNFSGTFTRDWVSSQISVAEQAYDQVADRAKKDGFTTAYDQATKGQASMTSWAGNIATWSPAQTYERAMTAFQKVWNDPNASFREKNAAAATAAGIIGNLAKTPGISTAFVAMLEGDAARLLGQDGGDTPSFASSLSGTAPVDINIQNQVATTAASEQLMKDNPGAYVYAPLNPDGTFDTTGKGPVGVIAATGVPADAVFVAQAGADGKPSMVMIKPTDVYVADPNNPDADPVLIGKAVTWSSGGTTNTLWGYMDGTGGAHWTPGNPWAEGTTLETDKNGNVTLHLAQANDPAQTAAAIEKEYPGLSLASIVSDAAAGGGKASSSTYVRDPETNKITQKVTVTYEGGKFTVTNTQQNYDAATGALVDGQSVTKPYSVVSAQTLQQQATAGANWSGGSVAGTYDSVVAASAAVNASKLNGSQMAALAQDPAFQQAFVTQTMKNLGTDNPLDPRVVNAWKNLTESASKPSYLTGGVPSWVPASQRSDLVYPGGSKTDPTKDEVSITFNGQQINLPNVPAYLKGASPESIANHVYGPFPPATPGNPGGQVLLPGQVPGQTTGPAAGPNAGTPQVNAATGFTQTKPPAVGTTGAPASVATGSTPNVNTSTGFTTPPAGPTGVGGNARRPL